MRMTKAMLEQHIRELELVLRARDQEIERLKALLNFSPMHNFLTATMSTNKLARRLVEKVMDTSSGRKF